MEIPLIGGAEAGRSSNISPSVALNWFPEMGKNGPALVSTHGCTTFVTPKRERLEGALNTTVRGIL